MMVLALQCRPGFHLPFPGVSGRAVLFRFLSGRAAFFFCGQSFCSALSAIAVPSKGTAKTLTAVGVSPRSAVQCLLHTDIFCGILVGKAPASYRNVLPKLLCILSGAFSYARTHPTMCWYESFLPHYAIGAFSHSKKCTCTGKCTAKCTAKTLTAVGLSLYQY